MRIEGTKDPETGRGREKGSEKEKGKLSVSVPENVRERGIRRESVNGTGTMTETENENERGKENGKGSERGNVNERGGEKERKKESARESGMKKKEDGKNAERREKTSGKKGAQEMVVKRESQKNVIEMKVVLVLANHPSVAVSILLIVIPIIVEMIKTRNADYSVKLCDLKNPAHSVQHAFQKTSRVDGKTVTENQRERTALDIMKKVTSKSAVHQGTNSGNRESRGTSLKVLEAESKIL